MLACTHTQEELETALKAARGELEAALDAVRDKTDEQRRTATKMNNLRVFYTNVVNDLCAVNGETLQKTATLRAERDELRAERDDLRVERHVLRAQLAKSRSAEQRALKALEDARESGAGSGTADAQERAERAERAGPETLAEMEPEDAVALLVADSVCPISNELMRDPVILVDGHTYEREHIETWFKTQEDAGHELTSPLTRLELESADVVPNHALRNVIVNALAMSRAAQARRARARAEALCAPVRAQELVTLASVAPKCAGAHVPRPAKRARED